MKMGYTSVQRPGVSTQCHQKKKRQAGPLASDYPLAVGEGVVEAAGEGKVWGAGTGFEPQEAAV